MNTCALCNTSKNLSYEHIPPQRGRKYEKNDKWTANISKPISTGLSSDVPYIDLNREINWQELRDKGWIKHSQNGTKVKTLCEKCNNFTGAEYGKAYADWANQWDAYFNEENISDNTARLKIKFDPLRLVKQVLSCHISIIHNSRILSDPVNQRLYGPLVNEIVSFISDTTKKQAFDKKISIFAHLTKELNTHGFLDWYFMTNNPKKPTDIIMYTASFCDGPLSYSLLFDTNSIYEPKHSNFRRQVGFYDPILDLSKYSNYPGKEVEQTINISYIEYGLYWHRKKIVKD